MAMTSNPGGNRVDTALVQAVARGIRSVEATHIHTAELNYWTSGTLDDPSWSGLVELDAAYTYLPTFAQVSAEYERTDHKPVFMVEAAYEGENNFIADGGSVANLRKQEYWTMLSGGSGQPVWQRLELAIGKGLAGASRYARNAAAQNHERPVRAAQMV